MGILLLPLIPGFAFGLAMGLAATLDFGFFDCKYYKYIHVRYNAIQCEYTIQYNVEYNTTSGACSFEMVFLGFATPDAFTAFALSARDFLKHAASFAAFIFNARCFASRLPFLDNPLSAAAAAFCSFLLFLYCPFWLTGALSRKLGFFGPFALPLSASGPLLASTACRSFTTSHDAKRFSGGSCLSITFVTVRVWEHTLVFAQPLQITHLTQYGLSGHLWMAGSSAQSVIQ